MEIHVETSVGITVSLCLLVATIGQYVLKLAVSGKLQSFLVFLSVSNIKMLWKGKAKGKAKPARGRHIKKKKPEQLVLPYPNDQDNQDNQK